MGVYGLIPVDGMNIVISMCTPFNLGVILHLLTIQRTTNPQIHQPLGYKSRTDVPCRILLEEHSHSRWVDMVIAGANPGSIREFPCCHAVAATKLNHRGMNR